MRFSAYDGALEAEGFCLLSHKIACRAAKSFAATALLVAAAMPMAAHAEGVQTTPAKPPCDAPKDLLRLANPLSRVARKLSAHQPIVIVAIGSSSTAGAGASSKAATYPSRLAVELKQHFPNEKITVLNRGIGGEEVLDMLKRFDKAVIEARPDLVLWQLGTNSVIRNHRMSDHGAAIRAGLKKIRAAGADVVLIDPQFAPKVIAKPDAALMVKLIAVTAKQEGVELFRRYDVMKRWHDRDNLKFDTFVSPDGLHMNDWSYACMAKGLGAAIAEAAQRPVLSATTGSHLVP
jgi:Lysophospholipase L1 and related esterases